MSSVFGRLNFSANNGTVVSDMSANTVSTIEKLPSFMNDWQTQDVANADTGGYFQNPINSEVTSVMGVGSSIMSIPGLNETSASPLFEVANGLYNTANSFYYHTNRISGVTPVNPDTVSLPHYDTAISAGKMVIYLTNKSDGIQNNAPIIGNFSSLFTSSNLVSYLSVIGGYPTLIQNTITATIDPLGGTTTYSSNITPEQISSITANVDIVKSFMDQKRTYDETFYTNCKSIIDDYNKVKQFSNMGDTEKYLVNNFVGSNKLLTRLDS